MPLVTDTETRRETLDSYEQLTPASRALWERALGSLPGGNTRTTIFHEPYPVYLVRGEGCRVTDADGVERIDFISNYTSLILGHCHPRVVEAVQRQAAQMTGAAAPSELEIELAERIRERLPSVELLRFTNSGTEATMLAIRAARAFTGRSTILTFAGAYHGTHDVAVSIPADGTGPGGAGVPTAVAETILVAPYNDVESTSAIVAPRLDDLAAVIVEPVLGAGGVIPAEPELLTYLRELTEDAGALLIFDEVISFRIGYHGAQGRYGVRPDLTALGKVIGGGLPIGAFGGRADVMDLFDPRSKSRLPHGGTFNGNPLSMAAGLATLAELAPGRYDELEALAIRLREQLEDSGVSVNQIGSLFRIVLPDEFSRALFLALLEHGILLTPRGMGCLSTPMTEAEIDALVDAAQRGLAQLGLA
jgi:glutamate-1-semialdehyde 2,1-aminomutase